MRVLWQRGWGYGGGYHTDPAIIARLPFSLDRRLANTDLSPYRGAIVGDAALAIGATARLAPCRCGPGGSLCLYAAPPQHCQDDPH